MGIPNGSRGTGVRVSASRSAAAARRGTPTDAGFDPGHATVAEVIEYLAGHEDDTERVVALERDGKARSTLLAVIAPD